MEPYNFFYSWYDLENEHFSFRGKNRTNNQIAMWMLDFNLAWDIYSHEISLIE